MFKLLIIDRFRKSIKVNNLLKSPTREIPSTPGHHSSPTIELSFSTWIPYSLYDCVILSIPPGIWKTKKNTNFYMENYLFKAFESFDINVISSLELPNIGSQIRIPLDHLVQSWRVRHLNKVVIDLKTEKNK